MAERFNSDDCAEFLISAEVSRITLPRECQGKIKEPYLQLSTKFAKGHFPDPSRRFWGRGYPSTASTAQWSGSRCAIRAPIPMQTIEW
jgi:hypothetical protein